MSNPNLDDDDQDLARDVGQEVRARRTAAGISMRALAQEAGISQPFLSNVEHGKSMPSMTTIYKLARALDASPGDLMPARGHIKVAVELVKAGGASKRIPVAVNNPRSAIGEVLMLDAESNLEVTEYRIAPEDHISEWFASPGTAAVYVINGQLDIEIAGEGTWRLGAGDFLRHDAGIEHRWHLVGETPAHALLMLAHTGARF